MGYPLEESEVLAVLLYTTMSDLCRELRKNELGIGNNFGRSKMPLFAFCLNAAIAKLALYDRYRPPRFLYHGLNNIKLNLDTLKQNRTTLYGVKLEADFSYSTFISLSEFKSIAAGFAKDEDEEGVQQNIIIRLDT